MKKLPGFEFEKKFEGFVVVGVDEVGRGALAGPVVAAAVAFFPCSLPFCSAHGSPRRFARVAYSALKKPARTCVDYWLSLGIDDSKRLTAKKREELSKIIRKNATWGIGEVGVSYINSHGIVKATEKAMRMAVKKIGRSPLFLLVDAFHVKYVPGVGLKRQKAIIKGDQKVISIAAASIIAKVYRDNLMIRLHKKFPRYGFQKHKGYGTRQHIEAINEHGISRLHRIAFVV